MRVLGYPRVSTDEQAEDGYSIQEQIETIQRWCKDNGHPPADIDLYIDDGYSAKDLKRPGIKRVIEAVKAKKYDIVVTTKLNRLSRKLFDILGLIDMFEQNNTAYVSVTENFDTSTYIGRMQMQMLGLIAEFERERIAADVRNTMRSIARKSGETKKAFTTPCYGYEVIDSKYVINTVENEALHIMAEMAIKGHGTLRIAKKMSELGYKSRSGGTWSKTSIRNILLHEALKGWIIYNRIYRKNGKVFTRPPDEWIIIEDHHPAIFTEEYYDEVKSALESRKRCFKQADNSRFLLTSLIWCGHCGSKMYGANRGEKNRSLNQFIYQCSNYTKKGGCFCHNVGRDIIEKFVLDDIIGVSEQSSTSKIVLSVAPKKEDVDERKVVEDKLKRLDFKMQRQIEAYEEELISASDLKKARERIDIQRVELLSLIKQVHTTDTTHDKVVSNAKRVKNEILSTDRLEVKNAIRKLIERIEILNGTEIRIIYKQV